MDDQKLTYKDIKELLPQDAAVEKEPLEDDSLLLGAGGEQALVRAVLLDKVDGDGSALVQLVVAINQEWNVVLGVELYIDGGRGR